MRLQHHPSWFTAPEVCTAAASDTLIAYTTSVMRLAIPLEQPQVEQDGGFCALGGATNQLIPPRTQQHSDGQPLHRPLAISARLTLGAFEHATGPTARFLFVAGSTLSGEGRFSSSQGVWYDLGEGILGERLRNRSRRSSPLVSRLGIPLLYGTVR